MEVTSMQDENTTASEKEKLQAKIKRYQDRLKSIENREKKKEEKKLAKVKDDFFKMLTGLGLTSVPVEKIESFLKAHKAELIGLPSPEESAKKLDAAQP